MPPYAGDIAVPRGQLAAVVTFLEMTARPAARTEPQAPGIFRRVEQADTDWYRDLHGRVGRDHLWALRLQMPRDRLAAILHDRDVELYALEIDGRAEGIVELDFREPEECEIVYFGVTATLVGTGAARWQMNRAIERAFARPIRRLWLHTCTNDHQKAIDFYRRSGFVPYRQAVEISPDPRVDGTLPRDAAPQIPIFE